MLANAAIEEMAVVFVLWEVSIIVDRGVAEMREASFTGQLSRGDNGRRDVHRSKEIANVRVTKSVVAEMDRNGHGEYGDTSTVVGVGANTSEGRVLHIYIALTAG